jgi:hypothetical protein
VAKNPRIARQPPNTGKQPRGGNLAPNVSTMLFKWRCDKLDWDGDWSWHQTDVQLVLGEIIPKLHEFENMTWGSIEGPTGSHFVSCGDLCKEAQERLNVIREETDELFSLRLTGAHRIWGIRDIAILRIIWWDPKHSVCPSVRKHT